MQPSPRPTSTSTRQGASPLPRQHVVNTQTKLIDSIHGRILCVADIRGRLSALNDLAREANAKAIIHTGDFGFFDSNSLERINDRTLRHLTMYSPLIPNTQRQHLLAQESTAASIRQTVNISLLSEFPLLLSGQIKLQVPVYTVWGACEDVVVLEKFRASTYNIENLHVLDEATTRCLDIGGVKLRLLGLGGALVPHKMFDNGDGNATIAGGQGTMWTTALQIGELVDTAQRVFDQTETRLLVTHASPGREGVIAQLALVLKADLTISAGLHFRYGSSYNEFSVQGDFEGFRHKLAIGKEGFDKVWDTVKTQVDKVIDENQRVLLDKALSVIERLPPAQTATGPGAPVNGEEPAWKNCWNWNLCDAAYGSLVLDVKEGRVSAELKSQGFNYAYRRTASTNNAVATPNSATPALPAGNPSSNPPTKGPTPAPQTERSMPPHLTNTSANNKSKPSTPSPEVSTKETPKEKEAAPLANVVAVVKPNGAAPGGDAEKDGRKKKEKKNGKTQDKAEKEVKEKETVTDVKKERNIATPTPEVQTGKSTPKLAAPSPAAEPSTSDTVTTAANAAVPESEIGSKSPTTESAGTSTPTRNKPKNNPWTIFIKLGSTGATESDLREFFLDSKDGITRVHITQGPYRNAFVEFGDEEAMKAGLEKHAEKLKDQVVEVKQANDRGDHSGRGGYRGSGGRGRGRGAGGAFAARSLAGQGMGPKGPGGGPRSNGDGGAPA